MNKIYPNKKKRIGNKGSFFVGILVFLLLGTVVNLYSQDRVQWRSRNLSRGKLWVTRTNSLRIGPIDHPTSSYTLNYPGFPVGADLSDQYNYVAAGGFMIYGEREGQPAAYTITGRFSTSSKYVYPTVTTWRIRNWNLLNDPSLPAEEMIGGAQHVIDLDVDVSFKAMNWSYPKYDDFVIYEYTITNTGSTPLDNLYFGTRYATWITEKGDWIGPGTDFDDKYGWDEDHGCFYFYDAESFRWEDEVPLQFNFGPGLETSDIGDPADILEAGARVHELYSPGYFTVLCLDPAGGNVYQNIVEYIGQGVSTDAPIEDLTLRLGTDPPPRYLDVMTHQQPRMSWDEARALGGEGGNKFEREPEFLLSCGPYNLAPGDSVTVVYAEVVGEMDRAKIVEGGVENVKLLATASKDSLMKHVEACEEFYQNGYIPDAYPPMTPTDSLGSLVLTPVGGGIKIEWPPIPDTYRDPLTGVNDFAGYRVYRSTYFCIGPWTMVADIPKASATVENGKVVYTDTGLPLGVGNYYTVTSYDTDGNESGKVNANRFPVYPLRAPNTDFPKNVYVVPNPFRQHSGLLGSGEELRIEFIGLPSKCTIRIYTLVGELVQEIKHDDGSGSESWGSIEKLDYQVNKWMMYVSPGLYIYQVKSEVPGHEGETYIGKFAIIK